ncbi:signal recognition particle protein Srp19 [Archaeoglobales archaeon]|nr:MAG: signal recognition particle protein Srp19 [Archaeoglobales archaeon]
MESKTYVVWTVNLDKKKSRSEGRRIPKRYSVPNVKLQELVEACKRLGLECVKEDKKYPKCWWEESGRIVVPKIESKTKLMIKLAQKISELREEKAKVKEKRAKKETKAKRRR